MGFFIKNHLLMQGSAKVPFGQTPNGGQALKPRFLVMHYTAGRNFKSSVDWFKNRKAKASAHLVIGRDGEICQTQAFNKTCWHAGVSQWKKLRGMNTYAIGIEIDNAGVLTKNATGAWHAWFGSEIAARDVLVAHHRLGGDERGWHRYTDRQIALAQDIAAALHAHYQFEDILGHEDISWPRKTDPGPAFPLQTIKAKILGRK